MSIFRFLLITGVIATLSACGSSVTRVDNVDEHAVSDRWNDRDSKLVSDKMINDMLTYPWLQGYRGSNPRPTVIIQRVRNKSHEHIAVDTFVNDIKRALIRSGKVDFVVAGAEREAIREERDDQELNASSATAAAMGEEQAADFALSGSINSHVDQGSDKRVTTYQIDLKLIDMTSNREVWNQQEKINKVMEKSLF